MVRGGPLSYLWFPEYGETQLIVIVGATRQRAYLDDSGDAQDWSQTRWQIVGGAIAPLDKWAELENSWRPYCCELRAAGLKDGLHMLSLVQASQIPVRRREQMIDTMYDLIEQIGAFPFGAAWLGGWLIGHTEDERPHPYDECVRSCARYAAADAARVLSDGEKIHLFLARKDGFVERAMNVYDEVRAESPHGEWLAPALSASSTPGEVMALQAADLIAYSFGFSLDRHMNSKVNIAAHLAARAVNRLAAMDSWLEVPELGGVYKPNQLILDRGQHDVS